MDDYDDEHDSWNCPVCAPILRAMFGDQFHFTGPPPILSEKTADGVYVITEAAPPPLRAELPRNSSGED